MKHKIELVKKSDVKEGFKLLEKIKGSKIEFDSKVKFNKKK